MKHSVRVMRSLDKENNKTMQEKESFVSAAHLSKGNSKEL